MRFAALLLLGMSTACLPKGVRLAHRMEGRYELGTLTDGGWERVQPGGADYAWWNPSQQATIYGDSNCGSRFADVRLDSLARHLRNGLRDVEELETRTTTLDGREARYSVWRGTLDGLSVQIAAVVLNKDTCTYDLIYLAPPATFGAGLDAFDRVLQGFRTRGGAR